MAGLAVAPDEHVVARLEEDDPGPDAATLERAAHRRERDGRVPGADIDHDGDPGEPLAVRRHELGEFGQELAGQVVDDGVAEILEELRRGGLAAPDRPLRITTAGSVTASDEGRTSAGSVTGRCA